MAAKETNKTLRDLAAVFFRYRGIFVFCAALFAIAVFVGAQFLPREYTASAKFERRLGEALSEQGLSGVSGTDLFESAKQTQIEDLAATELIQAVAAELGEFRHLKQLPQGIQKAVDFTIEEPISPADGDIYLHKIIPKDKKDKKDKPDTGLSSQTLQEVRKDRLYRWNRNSAKWEYLGTRAAWIKSFEVTTDLTAREPREPRVPAIGEYFRTGPGDGRVKDKEKDKYKSLATGQDLNRDFVYRWGVAPARSASDKAGTPQWLEVCDVPTWKFEVTRKEQRVDTIRKKMVITWDVKSQKVDVLSVSMTDPSKDVSYRFANLLVWDYMQDVYDRNHAMLIKSHDFLFKKNDAFQKELDSQEKKRIDLETRHPGVNAEQHQQIIWVEQRIAADAEAVERLLRISEAKLAKIKATKKPTTQLTEVQIVRGPNPEHERMGAELQKYKEELDLAITLRCMTPDHPAVKTLQERINIMEKRIRETPEEIDLQKILKEGGGGELYEAQKAAAEAEVDILSAELDRVQTQVLGYAKMNKDLDTPRKEYIACLARMDAIKIEAKNWQERLRQVEMALAAEENELRMSTQQIEEARKPLLPSSPKFAVVAGVALVGGLLLGGLMVFGFYRKDRSLSSSQLAESFLGVPVYGIISESAVAWKRTFRGTFRWTFALALLALVVLSGYLLQLRLRDEPAPDRLRPLQTFVQSMTGTSPPVLIAPQPATQAPVPATQPAVQSPVVSENSTVGRNS